MEKKNAKKARIRAALVIVTALCLLISAGCRKSPYVEAGIAPDANFPKYETEDFTFRFQAGFTSTDWEKLAENLTYQFELKSIGSRLTTLDYMISPERDKTTEDYLYFGVYRLDAPLEETALESVMEGVNRLDMDLNEGQISAIRLQAARIRTYNGKTALTYCLKLTRGEVTAVLQTALVPHESKLYQIVYADFTTGEDNTLLEKLLTSLSFK